MKKLLLILTLVFLVGCQSPSSNTKPTNENTESVEDVQDLKTVSGSISSTYVENDIKYVEVLSENEVLKLDASSYEDFMDLKKGQNITLTYNDQNDIVEVSNLQEVEEEIEAEVTEENPIVNVISLSDKYNLEGLNEYYNLSLEGFSEDILSVSIYIDAQKDDNGVFMYDDNHKFVLLASSKDGDYLLFDQRVQLGKIKINVFFEDDILKISLLEEGSAFLNFKIFEYDGSNFNERIYYQGQGNVNMIGQS